MILVFLISIVTVAFFLIAVSKSRASQQKGRKSPWPIVTVIAGVVFLFILGSVLYFVDYYSPKHWIEIVPIVDTSSQSKGMVGFSLPAGNYLIEVDREGDRRQDDSLIIKYILDVPQEGIKIEKEKNLDFSLVEQFRLDEFVLKRNKSDGVLSVEVLKPSKGKISVRLVTNRYFDM